MPPKYLHIQNSVTATREQKHQFNIKNLSAGSANCMERLKYQFHILNAFECQPVPTVTRQKLDKTTMS